MMIVESIRLQVMKRMDEEYAPQVRDRFKKVANEVLDMIRDLEADARMEAWKEGWEMAAKFGTGVYFGEADVESFISLRDQLLRDSKDNPGAILKLMPSILERIVEAKQ